MTSHQNHPTPLLIDLMNMQMKLTGLIGMQIIWIALIDSSNWYLMASWLFYLISKINFIDLINFPSS